MIKAGLLKQPLLYLFLWATFILGSCVTKVGTIKNPCYGEDFLNIRNLSKAELVKLARMLEASAYPSPEKNGCRAALLGQVYFALERTSLSSKYFSLAAEKLPELKDYLLLAKARVELKCRDFAQAEKIARSLLDANISNFSRAFLLRVRSLLADIAAEKKDTLQIIETHKELLQSGFLENEVLLFNLASSLMSAGEHKNADEVFKRLLVNFPTSKGAKHAEKIKSLADYQLPLKETEKRFDKLIQQLSFAQAVDDADNLLKNENIIKDNEARGQLESLAIKSLMLNNQFEQAHKRGKRLLKSANITVKEIESIAWTLGKVGHATDASSMYERLMTAARDRETKAKACFFKGFSLYEANLYPLAIFSWHSCHEEIKNSSHYENYLWYLALSSILTDNHQQALDHFKSLKTHFPQSKDEEKYTYFLAHTLRNMNKLRDAEAILRELSHKKKPSYYVLLARKKVGAKPVASLAIAPDALSKLAPISALGPSKNALILYHLGFKEEARDFMIQSNATSRDQLAMLQHLGFYHDAWQRSYLLNQNLQIIDGKVAVSESFRASYPMPHRNIIDESSRKFDVNKNLLYAIIQAESGFLEKAMSVRGAMGLMQMMPFVANDLATRVDITKFEPEQLTDPKVSIELGALFIALLKRQFQDEHLVIAAYNAGPHQVQKWLDLFGHLPIELFIERIPFKQTRDYVKTVLPNESLYHATSGNNLRLALAKDAMIKSFEVQHENN